MAEKPALLPLRLRRQRAPSLMGALPLGLTFVLGPDRFRTTLGSVGFCRALHLPEQVSVVLKRCSEIEVLGSKGTFEERQRTLVEEFCPTVLTLRFIDHGEIVERGG